MKKMICLGLILLHILALSGCGDSEIPKGKDTSKTNVTSTEKEGIQPDVAIEEIVWSFENGDIEGQKCVVLQFTNNSEYTINEFELKFEEKADLSDDDKKQIYSDLQKSQGFDDKYMNAFVKSREELDQPITMYGRCDEPIAPDSTSEKIKCYYIGGWTSKEVLHAEKFEPVKAIINYTKDDTSFTLNYDFKSKTYDVE